jgi:3-oxoadipate enol-lactonase
MSIAAWDTIASRLLNRLRVIRCDFRGQLLTPIPASPAEEGVYPLERHAADVVALLDHLGVERAHIAGTSFGALVAILAAVARPERVASLALITATDRLTPNMHAAARELETVARAAAGDGDRTEFFRRLAPRAFSERWLAEQPADFVETRARQIAALPPSFFHGIASLMVALRGLDIAASLPRIVAPTLVVGAELDRTFPPEHARALAAAIPGARLTMLEGCGHAAVVEAPSTIAALVADFAAGTILRSSFTEA